MSFVVTKRLVVCHFFINANWTVYPHLCPLHLIFSNIRESRLTFCFWTSVNSIKLSFYSRKKEWIEIFYDYFSVGTLYKPLTLSLNGAFNDIFLCRTRSAIYAATFPSVHSSSLFIIDSQQFPRFSQLHRFVVFAK